MVHKINSIVVYTALHVVKNNCYDTVINFDAGTMQQRFKLDPLSCNEL